MGCLDCLYVRNSVLFIKYIYFPSNQTWDVKFSVCRSAPVLFTVRHGISSRYDEKQYINASRISDGMIALPVGPHLDLEDMENIAIGLKNCMEKIKWIILKK